jgi:hypothetical protein
MKHFIMNQFFLSTFALSEERTIVKQKIKFKYKSSSTDKIFMCQML